MAGTKLLRKIQLGKETTAGTATTATTLWRGVGALKDNRTVTYVEEDVGIVGGTDRVILPQVGGEIEIAEGPCNFEQALHVFEAGIKKVGSGVVDTGGSG